MAAAAAKAPIRLAADEEPPIDSPIPNGGSLVKKNLKLIVKKFNSCFTLFVAEHRPRVLNTQSRLYPWAR